MTTASGEPPDELDELIAEATKDPIVAAAFAQAEAKRAATTSAALTALDDLAARLRRRHRDLLDEASGTIGDLAMRRLVHQAQGVDLALRDLMEVARGIK